MAIKQKVLYTVAIWLPNVRFGIFVKSKQEIEEDMWNTFQQGDYFPQWEKILFLVNKDILDTTTSFGPLMATIHKQL